MLKFNSPLNNIKIASPCSANWDEMYGNERKRFCGDCKLNVYNLSGMTREEAEDLIKNSEGRLCVRFYKRSDGSILTQNCPVGWARVKQRARITATAAFSLVMGLIGGVLSVPNFSKQEEIGTLRPRPTATPTPEFEHLMGAIAAPSPTPKQKPTPRSENEMVLGKMAVSEPTREQNRML